METTRKQQSENISFILKCIRSCKTSAQLASARRLYENFSKKYKLNTLNKQRLGKIKQYLSKLEFLMEIEDGKNQFKQDEKNKSTKKKAPKQKPVKEYIKAVKKNI